MNLRDAFQFNASSLTPESLQRVMMDIIELTNSRFRSFYPFVARTVIKEANDSGCSHVVELAAGNAPLTRYLLNDPEAEDLVLIPNDWIPKPDLYSELSKQHPRRVIARLEPVDFSKTHTWPSGSLLTLVAAFHHIRDEQRHVVFERLVNSADRLVIVSPVKRTAWCVLGAFGILVPALLLPWLTLTKPGRLRRFFWCYVLPLAPIFMVYDAISGCVKQWTAEEWEARLAEVPLPRPLRIQETWNSQTVIC